MQQDEYAGTFDGSWREFATALRNKHLPLLKKMVEHVIDGIKQNLEFLEESDYTVKCLMVGKEKMIPYLEQQLSQLRTFAKTLASDVQAAWPYREDYAMERDKERMYEMFIYDCIIMHLESIFDNAIVPADY